MDKKAERLVDVARMYYKQDRTQSEIVDQYGISRPMVNKLLKEARDKGIVTVRVGTLQEEPGGALSLMELVGRCSGIYDGVAVSDGPNNQTADEVVAEATISYLSGLGGTGLGIEWGHIIDDVVKHMKQGETLVPIGTFVYPLIGNGGVRPKNYHSNKLVRSIAEHDGAQSRFIYLSACVLSERGLKLTKELDSYHEVYHIWEKLDVALVNIGNFPSVPDLTSEARYRSQLVRQKTVGRILNCFMDSQGHIIRSDADYAIQIPLELLFGIRHVAGTCSANTGPKAFRGALEAGCLRYFIAPEHVVREALE